MGIQLTDVDIWRIECHGYEFDQIGSSTEPTIRMSDNIVNSPLKFYNIKRKPFNKECVFMEANKCTIHEFKPHSCRIFPFRYKIMDADTIQVHIHPSFICKSVKNTTESLSQNHAILSEFLKIQLQEIQIRAIYDEKF